MAKSDWDHAVLLLGAAGKDHLALMNMLDARSFSEEVFGFQYRYEAYDEHEAQLDREAMIGTTAALLSKVRSLIETTP